MNPPPKYQPQKRIYFIGLTGTPGAGKTTFCIALRNYMKRIGRNVKLINMDPAADNRVAYVPDWNITEIVSVQELMVGENLGFNGAIIKAWDLIDEYLDQIIQSLVSFEPFTFVILDFSGQVELFTTYTQIRNLYMKLQKMDHQVVNMYVLDSKICLDVPLFIAYSSNVLMSMFNLEVPHLNLLTKVDLLYHAKKNDKLPLSFDHYSSLVEENEELILSCQKDAKDPFEKKYAKLTESLSKLLIYSPTVSYQPFTVKDERFVQLILNDIDRCLYVVQPSTMDPEEAAHAGLVMRESQEERELREDVGVYLEQCSKSGAV